MTIETVMSVMTDDDPAAIVGKIEFESVIPANWDERKSVVAMRARQ
jgi:hypothetical protein